MHLFFVPEDAQCTETDLTLIFDSLAIITFLVNSGLRREPHLEMLTIVLPDSQFNSKASGT